MRSTSQYKFDPIGFILGLLMAIGFFAQPIVGLHISSHSQPYHVLQCLWILFLGLFYIYFGTKKLWERKSRQEQVHWYNQPMILFAVSCFFGEVFFLSVAIFGEAALDALPIPIVLLLFLPSLVCMLAALFFWFRRLLGYQRPKVQKNVGE
jgi:hypothetical protein